MLLKEIIPSLAKLSNTQLTYPAGGRVKVGGRYYSNDVSLTLSTATDLDTGVIANSTFYYVYAVIVSGALKLVASTSKIQPLNFSSYRKVGAFYTDSTGNVFKTYAFGSINTISYTGYCTSAGVLSQEGDDWIQGNPALAASVYTFTHVVGTFSLPPSVVYTVINSSTALVTHNAAPTATGFSSKQTNSSTGGATNNDFVIIAVKNGVDAVQPDWKL